MSLVVKTIGKGGQTALFAKVIGQGEPGGKTVGLSNIRERAEKAGIPIPDFISMTPFCFEEILDKSGARKANNQFDAGGCLRKYDFSPELLNPLQENLALMAKNCGIIDRLWWPLIVRSDDKGSTGVWESVPVVVSSDLNDSDMRIISCAMKNVLGSDFSYDAKEFRSKTNSQNIGVMIMPIAGDAPWRMNGEFIAPHLSISYIGKVNDLSYVAAGPGLGGANLKTNEGAVRLRTKNLPDELFLQVLKGKNGDGDLFVSALTLSSSKIEYKGFDRVELGKAKSLLYEFALKIEQLVTGKLPLSLEFAWSAKNHPQGALLQSDELAIQKVTQPQAKNEDTLISTSSVIGTKLCSADKVKLVIGSMSDKDVAFNRENNNYLLVIDIDDVKHGYWNLTGYSNAAALILQSDDGREISDYSHLGGMFRELGIPVLEGKFDHHKIPVSLHEKPVQDIRAIVYVDEFRSEGPLGFVAFDRFSAKQGEPLPK